MSGVPHGDGVRDVPLPTETRHSLAWAGGAVDVCEGFATTPFEFKMITSRHAIALQLERAFNGSDTRIGERQHKCNGGFSNRMSIAPAGFEQSGVSLSGHHHYFAMFLEPDFMLRAAGQQHLSGIKFDPVLAECDPVIRNLASIIRTECEQATPFGSLFVEHTATLMSLHLLRLYSNLNAFLLRPARGGLAPWQVRRATECMMARLAEDVSLSEVAELCDLSLAHFARAFRQSLGVPPYRWLLERRIERAKELLLDPHQPIAQLALDCGFTEQSHFTKVFGRTVGTSPGAWRRERRS